MTKNIYDQHRAAFNSVSAYVVTRNGARAASIAFKYPRDGASRLYAYVHYFGAPMVRGSAGGYGYDKRTAACNSASRALNEHKGHFGTMETEPFELFQSAIATDDGNDWERNLRNAGFDVWQAV